MKYIADISVINYGYEVEAQSAQEAEEKARQEYHKDNVSFYDGEISDMSVKIVSTPEKQKKKSSRDFSR